MSSIFIEPIIGQEAVCPDGLGRVVDYKSSFPHAYIRVQTYINDRSCKWAPENVRLVALPELIDPTEPNT